MTLNELVDKLDIVEASYGSEYINKAATMLRKQQAEIESLKKQLESSAKLNYNKGHEDGRKLVYVKDSNKI